MNWFARTSNDRVGFQLSFDLHCCDREVHARQKMSLWRADSRGSGRGGELMVARGDVTDHARKGSHCHSTINVLPHMTPACDDIRQSRLWTQSEVVCLLP